MNTLNTFYALYFIKLLSTDWKNFDAYHHGIIDEHGNLLKHPSPDEEKYYDAFIRIVVNIKRILQKIPMQQSLVGKVATAMHLLKEEDELWFKRISECLEESVALDFDKDELYYHGTNKPNSQNWKNLLAGKRNMYGSGIYITPNKELAQHYAGNYEHSNVIPLVKRGKLYNIEGNEEEYKKLGDYESFVHRLPTERANVKLQQLGYTGIKHGDTVMMFNSHDLKHPDAKFEKLGSLYEEGEQPVGEVPLNNISNIALVDKPLTKKPMKRFKEFVEELNEARDEDYIDRYNAGKELLKVKKSVKFNIGNAMITLHHGTSFENADKINKSNKFDKGTFFSANKNTANYYANQKHRNGTVFTVQVDPRDVSYSSGTDEFYAEHDLHRNEQGHYTRNNSNE